MNFDCVSFIDWLLPLVFGFGFVVGALSGVFLGIVIKWRLTRNILDRESE